MTEAKSSLSRSDHGNLLLDMPPVKRLSILNLRLFGNFIARAGAFIRVGVHQLVIGRHFEAPQRQEIEQGHRNWRLVVRNSRGRDARRHLRDPVGGADKAGPRAFPLRGDALIRFVEPIARYGAREQSHRNVERDTIGYHLAEQDGQAMVAIEEMPDPLGRQSQLVCSRPEPFHMRLRSAQAIRASSTNGD